MVAPAPHPGLRRPPEYPPNPVRKVRELKLNFDTKDKLRWTPADVHRDNEFAWAPMIEVAKLFGMSPKTLMNRPGSARGAGGVEPARATPVSATPADRTDGPRPVGQNGAVLLDGFNHAAILTGDTDRFVAFYQEVFEATTGAMMTGTVSRVQTLKGWFVMVRDSKISHPCNKLWGDG